MDTTRAMQAYNAQPVLYMALELSASKWVLGMSDGAKVRRVVVDASDRAAAQEQMLRAKAKFGLTAGAPVVSCYEAGRDGFWIHRWLVSIGVDNRVIDAASIEVAQRAKRVKTDRIDVNKLLELLLRACRGERGSWREVRVPSVEQEDLRRLPRERERLKKELTAQGNRIRGLLATQGVKVGLNKRFEQALQQVRGWDGQALPERLREELLRQWRRHELAQSQLQALEREQAQAVKAGQGVVTRQMQQLQRLCSISHHSPWVLCTEVFGWREVTNRRQLGSLAGLTPTPYASGTMQREQGISKAGLRRVRSMAVELSWLWLRYQSDSELSRWFQRRFGSTGSKRSRRIGIVAMARKLLVALWRYLNEGIVPAGAVLKPL